MTTVALTTLGCKVNRFETAGIAEALRQEGYELVSFTSRADLYIINTCSVTGRTDYQSRQLIRRANRLNPDAHIIVTGCYAQMAPDMVSDIEGVSLVVGSALKDRIPELIQQGRHRSGGILVDTMEETRPFTALPLSELEGQTRAYLKIQDGCDSFCHFCIIPYARGRSRSRPAGEVIDQVRGFVRSGYREVVLTGIHLGHYGLDLDPPCDLAMILRRTEAETSLERIRVSSLEPMDIGEGLLDFIGSSNRLCPHFHLALQSGDDRILELMGRNYRTADFRDMVTALLDRSPHAAIGIDIMAGYPGEGDREFENTLAFVESLPLAYFHVFPYSRRPGTPAALMPQQVPENIKHERARILRELGAAMTRRFRGQYIGNTLPVLIEDTRDRPSGRFRGFSHTYIPVSVIGCNGAMVNRIVPVTIESIDEGGRLVGRVEQG